MYQLTPFNTLLFPLIDVARNLEVSLNSVSDSVKMIDCQTSVRTLKRFDFLINASYLVVIDFTTWAYIVTCGLIRVSWVLTQWLSPARDRHFHAESAT